MPPRSPLPLAILLLCAGPAQAQLAGYNPVACTIQYERTGFNELMQLCRSNPDGGVATGFRSGSSSVRCHEAQAWAHQCGWPYKPLPPLPQARTASSRQEPPRAPQPASLPDDQPGGFGPGYDMSIIGGFRPYDEPLVIDPPRDPRRRPARASLRLPDARAPALDQQGERCVSLKQHGKRELGGGRTENILVLASSASCAAAAIPVWAKGSDGKYRSGMLERGATRELSCVTHLGEAQPCYGLIDWGEGQVPAD